MAVPRIVDDGDFQTAGVIGSPEWSTPFALQGDALTFEMRLKYRIDQARYKRAKNMQRVATPKGIAYLVDESDTSDIGLGVLEFTRTYASLPKLRIEGTSIVYPFQYLSTSASYDWATPPAEPAVFEVPLNVNAEIQYEYFLKRPVAQVAPKVAVIYGTVFRYGGWGTIFPGQRVLAEDSTIEIYKAGIYVRRGVYIKWPTVQTSS